MEIIETEQQKRDVAAKRMSAAGENDAAARAVDAWLEQHPEVAIGAPVDTQAAYRWWYSQVPHQFPLNDSPNFLTILNTSILTNWGCYDYQPLTLDEARGIYATMEYGPQMVQSAVGHAATAAILYDLLGASAGILNRVEYRQPVGARALVFKLKGRPPEGKILSREEVEAIGYDFGMLTRIS